MNISRICCIALSYPAVRRSKPGYLYLLFEHKSYPDRWIALHLLCYQVKIWELFVKQNKRAKALPVIIPMVLYHGKQRWMAGTRFSDLISPPDEELRLYVPDFSYLLYDLSAYRDDQIRGMAIVRVTLLLLKYIHHPQFTAYLRHIFPLLRDLSQPGRGLTYLESIIRYVFNAADRVSMDELKEIIEENISEDKEELIMTLAEQLIQQGRQEGRQEGKQEGIEQGIQQGIQQGKIKMARDAILDILETRFSDIPESLRLKLEGVIDRAVLEDLLRKAVTIASPAELEKKFPAGNAS